MRVKPVNKHGEFAFDDQSIGVGTHRYMSVIQHPDGSASRLVAGRDYALMILPTDPSRAVVSEPETGVVLGIAPRVTKVDRCNARAIELAQELQAVQIAGVNAPIQERHVDAAEMLASGIAANEALLRDITRMQAAEIVVDHGDPEDDAETEAALSMLEEMTK